MLFGITEYMFSTSLKRFLASMMFRFKSPPHIIGKFGKFIFASATIFDSSTSNDVLWLGLE